ncbi:S-layer homology domain-containing protein [Solibacillus sp. FSL H8-0538]|uniref:S-layer homology domain-containing protein n=1 Tax=Solibacillus sp. FSL H8-0538 TaxID=2921400 RepID=UPI0030F65B0C
MKKKLHYFKATVATAVLASAVTPFAPVPTVASVYFNDVHESDYFYDALAELYDRGVVQTFPNGTIRPHQNLTRGQTAQIIADVLQLDTDDVTNPYFRDISTSHPYYGAIAALSELGIIGGYEDGTFRPNAYVQRHHIAKFLTNAFQLETTLADELPFTDVPEAYRYYVAALYENQITTGKTAKTFNGTANVTRGQLAAFIVRAEQSQWAEPIVTSTQRQSGEFSVTVKNITSTTIQTSQGTYRVDEKLQQLLHATNRKALQDAQLVIRVSNNKISRLSSVTLNSDNTTFDGGNLVIPGNVLVNADDLTIKNVTINGNLTIANEVTNYFSTNNISVDGNLEIGNRVSSTSFYSGPTISLQDSLIKTIDAQVNYVTINSNNILLDVRASERLASLTLNARVQKVNVNTTTPITISGSGAIEQIAVNSTSDITLTGDGQISEVILNNSITRISLGDYIYIKKLISPLGRSAQASVLNYNLVRGQIREFESSTLNNYLYNDTSGESEFAQVRTIIETLNIKWEGNLSATYLEAQRKLAQIKLPAGTYVKAQAGTDYYIGNVLIHLINDDDTIIQVIGPIQVATNKSSLQNLISTIAYVNVSIDGKDIGQAQKWTTSKERQVLHNAVTVAQSVINNYYATQTEVDNAYTLLQSAIKRYYAAQKWGNYSQTNKAYLSAEISAITFVKTSIDGTDIGTTQKWTTLNELIVFQNAIHSAQAVANNPLATQREVDTALYTLQIAINNYAAAHQWGRSISL